MKLGKKTYNFVSVASVSEAGLVWYGNVVDISEGGGGEWGESGRVWKGPPTSLLGSELCCACCFPPVTPLKVEFCIERGSGAIQ